MEIILNLVSLLYYVKKCGRYGILYLLQLNTYPWKKITKRDLLDRRHTNGLNTLDICGILKTVS